MSEDSPGSGSWRQPGKYLHDVAEVPQFFRQETQERWGVNVELHAARENGRYKGPILTSSDYVAQRVGDDSVVIHRRDQVDFATSDNLRKREETNRLNDVNLTIYYDGDRARASYHDPQRAAIEDMFRRIGRNSEHTIDNDDERQIFMKQLGGVKDLMVAQYREAKNRQFDQRSSHAHDQNQSRATESMDAER